MNNYGILIICIEGKDCNTEKNFFASIVDANVRFVAMDSANKSTLESRWQKYKERIIDPINTLLDFNDTIYVFIIHDWDDPKSYESLELTSKMLFENLNNIANANNLQIHKTAIYDEGLSFDWFIATLFYPEDSLKCKSIDEKKRLAKKVVKEESIKEEKYWSKIVKKNNWELETKPSNISYRKFLRNTFTSVHKQISNYWKIIDLILNRIED